MHVKQLHAAQAFKVSHTQTTQTRHAPPTSFSAISVSFRRGSVSSTCGALDQSTTIQLPRLRLLVHISEAQELQRRIPKRLCLSLAIDKIRSIHRPQTGPSLVGAADVLAITGSKGLATLAESLVASTWPFARVHVTQMSAHCEVARILKVASWLKICGNDEARS
jgi:hypothetical protein